jgi:hypothetical protein
MKPLLKKIACAAALAAAMAAPAHADAVSDWNARANQLLADARMGTPPAVRAMALVQTAVLEAVQSIRTARPGSDAAAQAAVAAATRATLLRLAPALEAPLNATYQQALAGIAESGDKAAGIEAGEKAAASVLAARADDGASAPERYRPHAAPGSYVPTGIPAVPQWGQRKPWLMAQPGQFRPAPPPQTASADWARAYDEVKLLGSRASKSRSAQQTDVARFWEYSLPSIYTQLASGIAEAPGRGLLRNARLYAALAQGMDDALIAVMDAKYHYNFWRPITAIRNGDADGNDATERDAGWLPLIDVPGHPEYPSAHTILAGSVGAVLQAEIGRGPVPVLSTTSPTLKGVSRRYASVNEFMQEVADARVWQGIHYRFSSDAGLAMGKRIGALAAERHLAAAH